MGIGGRNEKERPWGGRSCEGGVVGYVRLGAGIGQAFKRGSRSPFCLGKNLGASRERVVVTATMSAGSQRGLKFL